MGFLTGLFGGETNIWTILLALIIVIALIFFGVWILKLIFKASVTIAGGRKRRLAMVDSLAIDNKRNVILIRRDNVEHLIMVSNTGELLIEGSIPAGASGAEIKANFETKAPAAQSERKTPSLDAKAPAIVAGGVAAAAGLAASGVAAMAASKQNSNSGEQSSNTSAKPQNTPAQKHVADRLGLSRLLRRNDEDKPQAPKFQALKFQEPKSAEHKDAESAPILASTQSPQPQKNTAPVAPVAAASASVNAQTIISAAIKTAPSDAQTSKTAPFFSNNTVTPLRTSGILKPVSEMTPGNSDIAPPEKEEKNTTEIKNNPVEDSPVEDSLVEDSPVENSPIKNSPLESKAVAIEPVGDSADKADVISLKENSKTTETDKAIKTKEIEGINSAHDEAHDEAHGNEAKPDETSKKLPKEAKDPQITEEVTSHEEDNTKAISPDSAKNEVQQIDAKAMESIEEGTISGDDGANSSKEARDSGSAKGPKSSEKNS
ncbi:hypothetical protein MNBD_ALPHA11-180 [hydrothermal vent metagenome]|uniref:Flagellar biosynthesis protein FliO n=1 Tax=hydrothermal vent metagenome TaxID=652676 RepID=A0A3B0UJK7_9ZZZZ